MLFVANFLISPFNFTISFTNFEEIIWFSTSDIKNKVSILLFNFLFIPASWNSYSKSDTALKPLNIIFDLYFLQREVVNDWNEIKITEKMKKMLKKQVWFYRNYSKSSTLKMQSGKTILLVNTDTRRAIMLISEKD